MKKKITDIMCKINHIIRIFSKIFTQLIGANQGTHGKAISTGTCSPHRVSNLGYGFSPHGQRAM